MNKTKDLFRQKIRDNTLTAELPPAQQRKLHACGAIRREDSTFGSFEARERERERELVQDTLDRARRNNWSFQELQMGNLLRAAALVENHPTESSEAIRSLWKLDQQDGIKLKDVQTIEDLSLVARKAKCVLSSALVRDYFLHSGSADQVNLLLNRKLKLGRSFFRRTQVGY